MRSDNCTTNFVQLLRQPFFLYFYWTKTTERERERGRIKKTCGYERDDCFKSCQKVDVQISFLFKFIASSVITKYKGYL